MPNFDKTGPAGKGPKTGRQQGNCEGAVPQQGPAQGRNQGNGPRGRGGRGAGIGTSQGRGGGRGLFARTLNK